MNGKPDKHFMCDSDFFVNRIKPIIKKHKLKQGEYIEFATKAFESWEKDQETIVGTLKQTILKQREIIDNMMKTFGVVEVKGYNDF